MQQNQFNFFNLACLEVQEVMGKVSASTTHEIKNQLAVLSEQAGLLHDLSVAACDKGGMDAAKVEDLSKRIRHRVDLSNAIVKRYNSFAHLADNTVGPVHAEQILDLMVGIYRRLAGMKSVELTLRPNAPDMELTSRPMFLAVALFKCLQTAVTAAPAGGEVAARVVDLGEDAGFEFNWSEGKDELHGGPGTALLNALHANLRKPSGETGLVLAAPCGWPEAEEAMN